MSKKVEISYNIGSKSLELGFDDYGDFLSLKINGVDRSQDGDAIDAVIAAISEAGHDLQQDISDAFEIKYAPYISRYLNPDYLYESNRDQIICGDGQ